MEQKKDRDPLTGKPEKNERTESSKTLEQGLKILKCFLQGDEAELSLTELARMTDRNTTSVFRLIASLEKEGFLERNRLNRKYFLGTALKQLGRRIREKERGESTDRLILIARPYLARIRDRVNENTSLYIYRNCRRVCIQRLECTHELRQARRIGEELPLTVGAGGTAMLAALPRALRRSILKAEGGPSEQQLDELLERGYEVSRDAMGQGITGIGVPLVYSRELLPASLNVSGPVTRMTPELVREAVSLLKDAAEKIAEECARAGL